jgi:hypothetical protein
MILWCSFPSGMNQATLRRAATFADQWSEWLILLFLLVGCIPTVLIRHESLRIVPKLSQLGLIDASWVLDTSYKAAGGIWFGRDVAFTYGPLFQWLSSAPSLWVGLSAGTVFATWYMLPFVLIVASTFLTARLILPDAAPWRRALLVLLAVVFWSPPDVRVSVCLLAFAVFVHVTGSIAEGQTGKVWRSLACAAFCVGAFWLSADTGVYTTIALLLCIATAAISERSLRPFCLFALLVAGFFAALVFLTNLALASLFDFHFWRSSLAIATGYRWFEPLAMSKADKHLVMAALVIGAVVFGTAWGWRKFDGPWTRRPVFLLAGFALAVLMMQSALVRSDHGHVLVGVYPMAFLCGAIALAEFGPRWLSAGLPLLTVILSVSLASAYPLFRPGEVLRRWQEIRHPLLSCPAGTAQLDHACFAASDAELLTKVSAYVGKRTAPKDQIAVFPYQTVFGLASRRQVAGGVLQSYLVNGEYLTNLEMAGLRRSQPSVALYFPDGLTSMAIDGVPNFTRSPELWFYLLRHYRAEGSPASGVVGLVRDDTRQGRVLSGENETGERIPPVRITGRHTTIDLRPFLWEHVPGDFVKMRLRVSYPFWWRLRKPSKMTLLFSFIDGTQRPVQFVLPPNETSDVWVFLGNDNDLGSYFSDNPEQWKQSRPAVAGLKLSVMPFDWISVAPQAITIESIDVVRFALKPQ